VPLSISKNNSFKKPDLLADFRANGAVKGLRNKTLFALGLFIKHRLGKTASFEAIRGELLQGAVRCHVPRKELERTLKNIMKTSYTNPLSLSKLREWCNSKYHDIPLH